MASNIGALARQEQAEEPKSQKKEAKSSPRPAQERQEAILDDFRSILQESFNGAGHIGSPRKSLSWRIRRPGKDPGVAIQSTVVTASGGRRI